MVHPHEVTPVVPNHTELRWLSRSKVPELTVTAAWAESVPVGIPDDCHYGPRARLHDPAGVLLMYALAKEKNRHLVIRTVLDASIVEESCGLNDDHLRVHEVCGYRYEPGNGDCHWCESGYEPLRA